MNNRQVMEWIPYESLNNIQFIAKGGFDCKVYSGTWLKGNILYWDSKKKAWARNSPVSVALKQFENSHNITSNFFEELKTYHLYGSDNNGIIEFYGISQDPNTKNYILVTEFASKGNLRNYLIENHKSLNWERKINILLKISVALQDIHSSGFTHRNLHGGNILLHDDHEYPKISDLTLSKYIDDNKNQKFYGVLPFVAPEILRGEEFSSAADIYSFSMLMWQVSSGIPPFSNKPYDNQLAIDICNGKRPKIVSKTPKSFSTLMERCWDADPSLRPNVQEITAMLFRWHFSLEQNRSTDIVNAFMVNNRKTVAAQIDSESHLEVNYNSQLLDFKDLPEPTNYYSRIHCHDSAYGSSTNTLSSYKPSEASSLSKSSMNSLSDESKRPPLRKTPTYAESLRKQQQASVTYFYHAEPTSKLGKY
ncbi:kinase-like domain-containing protein [Glomus cerebriforme]|uniref:Kinase-like domain-containing protein n=1 Tax=Glomus cerebriforme TaxID=658196 RepID=A0A397TM13_9GLOM|nr:kinase-like domain-containing protein [Glomus cerebriforme]